MKIDITGDGAFVYTPYNAEFVKKVKAIGGAKWDGEKKAWRIPANAVDSVRAIMREVYGETDETTEKKVNVRLTFAETVYEWHAPVTIFGKTVASATGRDSGARVGEDVAFLSGAPKSGGSVKNWETVIPAGCVCILYDVPESIISADRAPEGVSFEIEARNKKLDLADLIAERDLLLKRIAEIDAILAEN